MRMIVSVTAALLAAMPAAMAQSKSMDMTAGNAAVKWGPAPPGLPKGAQIAVLSGDPSKAEPYVMRLKLPDGYVVAAHHHPTIESVTVLSGQFHAGMGDKVDKSKGLLFQAGGFASIPAGMNHYAWTTAPTVLQVHGIGPAILEYVNPADDPSKAK